MTGGAGFIGRHLAASLLRHDFQITIVDIANIPTELRKDPRVRYHRGSVLDDALMADLIPDSDLVIHLAGIASPDRYGADPLETMDTNLVGALAVSRKCAEFGVRILFSSTSEVYGTNPDLPWHERADRVLGPVQNTRWCYSTSKAAAEHYLDALRRKRGLDYTIVRLFNAYGAGLDGRVVDRFISAALEHRPLTVLGDGEQTRCFCYIDDVTDALTRLVLSPAGGGKTYNIGTDVETRIIDFARLVIELTASRSTIVTAPGRSLYEGYQDVPRRRPDISAIRRDLGWAPSTDLKAGLAATIAAFRAEPALT